MAENENEEIFIPHGLTPEEKARYKRLAIKYGVFTGILILMFAILVIFSYAGRNSWENGLRANLVQTLDENNLPYEVVSFLPMNSPFAVSSAAFLLRTAENSYATALILRTTTLFGPQAGVFICKDEKTEFISFLTLNQKTQNAVTQVSERSQIAYWSKRIPRLLKEIEYPSFQLDDIQMENENEEE